MRGAPFILNRSTSASLNCSGSNFRHAEPAHIAKREITNFADIALGSFVMLPGFAWKILPAVAR